MAIFDLSKDDLGRLSETQLEELLARLAEADVAMRGHSPACVSWSGAITAPDAGIDIHVQVVAASFDTGFLQKPDTIIQCKKHSMPRSAILAEMAPGGALSETIAGQANLGGSYIIVSLADDCSPPSMAKRIKAMREAVENDPNKSNLHLDFFDRSKLLQWVRHHPAILLWVKNKLGQGYSGWQPFGAWSNPPRGAVDALICAPGVMITLPASQGKKLSIEDAINPMRDLIRATQKAIRITGLSGVGKTRIVQALFDETVGINALDRTITVYVDTGAEPDPTATAMLDRLIAEGKPVIMVIDNCPPALHSSLASRLSASASAVHLITVEYDIRDDKPQTTEVIHIEAVGPDIAEQLIMRRFPQVGQGNARHIAKFADGNARVALAIAERVEEGDSLVQLSDTQLFDRLFEQGKHPDDNLRQHAELLSLVYSFSVANPEVGQNELKTLGAIAGSTHFQLLRSLNKLSERHIAQKRSHWRAILPHAIANRLTSSALNNIPIDTLRATFERSGNARLLTSFAHRLGLMHDHPVAQEIVEEWLIPDGLLGQITALDDNGAKMLDYIGPVAPGTLLKRIEAVIGASDFEGMEPRYNPRRTTILNLLQSLAYEPNMFERCLRLMIRVADYEDENNNYDAVRDKIIHFFQAYLSGTHATLDQRLKIMNECLSSDVPQHQSLGLKMLSRGLDWPPWKGSGMNEFGARPRDFGYYPNYNQLVQWRCAFIDVAASLGNCGAPELERKVRRILANEFRGMWHQEGIQAKLIEAAETLHTHRPWSEGWKAIRSTIYFDYTRRKGEDEPEPLPVRLAELATKLAPNDLLTEIATFVLSNGHDDFSLDADLEDSGSDRFEEARKRRNVKATQLGESFAISARDLSELGSSLYTNDWMPNRFAFGQGLAKGAHDACLEWGKLIDSLKNHTDPNKEFSVICGFIAEVDNIDPMLAQSLLDQCAKHPELRNVLIALHPRREYSEADLDRCMALLDEPDTRPWMYEPILWSEQFAHLPENRIMELFQRLLTKETGDDLILHALSMRLHDKSETEDTLGIGLRLIGLKAATQRIQKDERDHAGAKDHDMARVIDAALRFDGNQAEKLEWLDSIFKIVNQHYGYLHSFGGSVAKAAELMPNEFLTRVFSGSDGDRRRQRFFIRHGVSEHSPLAGIDARLLLDWCVANDDPSVWETIAAGIRLWSQEEGSSEVGISKAALLLLDAAPDPSLVLEAYADRVEPSVWSGSRADIMQPKANLIGKLSAHSSSKIASAAVLVFQKLVSRIEHERQRDRIRDEEREQTFE